MHVNQMSAVAESGKNEGGLTCITFRGFEQECTHQLCEYAQRSLSAIHT